MIPPNSAWLCRLLIPMLLRITCILAWDLWSTNDPMVKDQRVRSLLVQNSQKEKNLPIFVMLRNRKQMCRTTTLAYYGEALFITTHEELLTGSSHSFGNTFFNMYDPALCSLFRWKTQLGIWITGENNKRRRKATGGRFCIFSSFLPSSLFLFIYSLCV